MVYEWAYGWGGGGGIVGGERAQGSGKVCRARLLGCIGTLAAGTDWCFAQAHTFDTRLTAHGTTRAACRPEQASAPSCLCSRAMQVGPIIPTCWQSPRPGCVQQSCLQQRGSVAPAPALPCCLRFWIDAWQLVVLVAVGGRKHAAALVVTQCCKLGRWPCCVNVRAS